VLSDFTDKTASTWIDQPVDALMKWYESVLDEYRREREALLKSARPNSSNDSNRGKASVDGRYVGCHLCRGLNAALIDFLEKKSPEVVPHIVRRLRVEAGQDMLDHRQGAVVEEIERNIQEAAHAQAEAAREKRMNEKEKEFKAERALHGRTDGLPQELRKRVRKLGQATYANELNKQLYLHYDAKLLYLLRLRDDNRASRRAGAQGGGPTKETQYHCHKFNHCDKCNICRAAT
jgi:hypothetical protein